MNWEGLQLKIWPFVSFWFVYRFTPSLGRHTKKTSLPSIFFYPAIKIVRSAVKHPFNNIIFAA